MAGYAKLWNDIWNDEWFLSLKGNERGLFLQLISFAKARGDNPVIFLRKVAGFSHEFAFDSKTTRRMLGKFHDDGAIRMHETGDGMLRVELVNWYYWQNVRTVKGNSPAEREWRKIPEKSALPDQTRPNQTKPDQTSGAGRQMSPSISSPDQRQENAITLCAEILDYYNERVTAIGKTMLRMDMISRKLRDQFESCLRQKDFTKAELKRAIDGCLGAKFNREKGRLKFGTIFKDADTVNGYILASENPELDDAGNEVKSSDKKNARMLDELGID